MPTRIDEIVSVGVSKLDKKFMGGVTAESAQRAIRETAQKTHDYVKGLEMAAIDKLKSDNEAAMTALKEAHLKEMAAKDKENLSLKLTGEAVAKEKDTVSAKLAKLMARINDGLTFKKIDTLSDGSKVYEKHNLNGAKALKTVNNEGITTQVNVVSGKTFRRTSYNPLTQKPTRTVTNATPKGETVEIIYDSYGRGGKAKVLNTKKTKNTETPILVERKKQNISDKTVEVENFYSDGSKMTAQVNKQTNEVYNWTKWKNPNRYWNEWYSKDFQTGIVTRGKVIEDANGKRGYERRVISSPTGIVRTYPYSRHEDKLTGLITNVERINFPKNSPVKRVEKFIPEGTNSISKSVVKMKNGTVYEMSDYKKVPSNRELRPGGGLDVLAPQKVVKVTKDGAKVDMKQEEIMPWLESFHPDYNFKLIGK